MGIRHIAIILLLALPCLASAQRPTYLDSLHGVWLNKKLPDSVRFTAFHTFIKEGFLFTHPDTALVLAQEQLDHARTKGLDKFVAIALNTQGTAMRQLGRAAEAMPLFRHSLAIRTKMGSKAGMAGSINNIGTVFLDLNRPDSALHYFKWGLRLKREVGDSAGLSSSYHNIGIILADVGLRDSALIYMQQGLDIDLALGDMVAAANSYGSMGHRAYDAGKDSLALFYYTKSLETALSARYPQGVGDAHNNIGGYYAAKGLLAQSVQHYRESLRVRRRIGDKKDMADCLINLALGSNDMKLFAEGERYLKDAEDIYHELEEMHGIARVQLIRGHALYSVKRFDDALTMFRQAKKYEAGTGQLRSMGEITESLASTFTELGKWDSAQSEIDQSFKIWEQLDDQHGLARVCLTKAQIMKALGGPSGDYLKLASRGLELARNIGAMREMEQGALFLYEAYARTGQPAKALEMHELYIQMRDSIASEENQKEVMRQQFQYDYDKKEALLAAEQDKKDAIASEQLRRKNQQRNAFIGGLALTLGLTGVSYRSYRRKKRDNVIITAQKQAVEEKNHAILESINYARRLQEAVLPPPKVVKEFFNDSFLLYMPRDIVSGDFYWMESSNSISYFAIGDCTGHGVPGAMLSVMGLNGLNRALNELKLTEPKNLLIQLTKDLQDAFERNESTVRDGMDIALCALNLDTMTLTFCGANNPLWIARQGEMLQFKPNKRPVGHYDAERGFEQEVIKLQPGDIIYLHSDGYQDQLGGPEHKKFMTKRYRELLLSISTEPMPKQRELLIAEHNAWKGTGEQTDDVCVMGVRV